MLLIYVYVTVVVPLCRSRHSSFIIALVDLSGSARLSVHWPQNCFYKCKSRCFIALQPNRITRLFSYSREVEQRLRAAQMKTYGHLCVCVSFFLFLPCSFLSLPLPLSYIIFPHLSYLSRLSQDPCPSSLPSPPFNKYTSVAWASANVGCLATEFFEPHLRRASFFLVGLLKATSEPAQLAGADCQSASGVFPLTFGYHGLNQRARLGSAETDAFCSCLLVWFWRELGFVITYCISCLLYLRIEENLQPGCALLCCLFCWEGAWLLWDCTVRWPW